jgi:hypothetical protein
MLKQTIYSYDSNILNGIYFNTSANKQIFAPLKEMNDLKSSKLERTDIKSSFNSIFSNIDSHINAENVIVNQENNPKFNILNSECNFELGLHYFENPSKKFPVGATTHSYLNGGTGVQAALSAKNNERLDYTNATKHIFNIKSFETNYNDLNITTSKIFNENEAYKTKLNDELNQVSVPSIQPHSYSSSSISNSSSIVGLNEKNILSKAFDFESSKCIQKAREDIWSNVQKNENKCRTEKKGKIIMFFE